MEMKLPIKRLPPDKSGDGPPFKMEDKPEEFRQEILSHYALFLQYYWGEGPLSQVALAHYIFLDCAVYPSRIIVCEGGREILSNFDVFYGTAGGFDNIMATSPPTSKDYCMARAGEIPEFISIGWIDKEKMLKLLASIMPQGIEPKMAWDFSLQNMAKARGELKKRLSQALHSNELKNMPAPIREINEYHLNELLMMYRLEIRCPDCAWEMPWLGGIALLKGGDEQVLNYLQCESCGEYFIYDTWEGMREAEPGYAESSSVYKIPKEQAERDMAAIKKCPDPYDKHCNCKSHLDHFDSKS